MEPRARGRAPHPTFTAALRGGRRADPRPAAHLYRRVGGRRSVIPGYDSERDVTRTSRAGENIGGAVLLCGAFGAFVGAENIGAGAGAGTGVVVGMVLYLLLSALMRGGPMGS